MQVIWVTILLSTEPKPVFPRYVLKNALGKNQDLFDNVFLPKFVNFIDCSLTMFSQEVDGKLIASAWPSPPFSITYHGRKISLICFLIESLELSF